MTIFSLIFVHFSHVKVCNPPESRSHLIIYRCSRCFNGYRKAENRCQMFCYSSTDGATIQNRITETRLLQLDVGLWRQSLAGEVGVTSLPATDDTGNSNLRMNDDWLCCWQQFGRMREVSFVGSAKEHTTCDLDLRGSTRP